MRKILILAGAFLAMSVSSAAFADADVTQADQTFSQESVTLKAGESINFINKDTVTHNIKIINAGGDTEDKGLQKPGEVIKEKFDKAGEYKVRCGIHPKMKIAVTVQ